MTDSTFKSKSKITAAVANAKPKFIATVITCIGKIDVILYPPTKKGYRFAVALKTKKGGKRTYYRRHIQKKPVTLSKRLKLKNKKRKLSLIQTTDDKFDLKHVGLPDCHIEIVDYGIKLPPTEYNGIGLIVASIIGTNASGYQPINSAQQEEETDWFGPFDFWTDEIDEIAEVIGDSNNPWESGGTGNDDDDEDNDNNDDNNNGEQSWWDSVRDWLMEEH